MRLTTLVGLSLLSLNLFSVSAVAQSKLLGWTGSMNGKQFIDPPAFEMLRIPGTVEYRAELRQGDKKLVVKSSSPRINLEKIWPSLDTSLFSVNFEWVDQDGKIKAAEKIQRVKAPDWDGFKEAPANWVAAANRAMAFQINPQSDDPHVYREANYPVWIWSGGPGFSSNYPSNAFGQQLPGFLTYARLHGPQSKEALRMAELMGEWSLKNRHPNSGALPLFPYSIISKGKLGEGYGAESASSMNLVRCCWFASKFVDLYKVTRKRDYLDYARHIADITMKFQNADGSFPFRVDPKTGAVREQYTPYALDFVMLVEALAPYGFDEKRAVAAHKSVEWMLAYVCSTNYWKAAYEDMGFPLPNGNLAPWPALMMIKYLCQHKDEDPSYVSLAKRLNRFVEDQFVTFGIRKYYGDQIDKTGFFVRVKGPLVFEQYTCWVPMEGVTANWIESLIALHKATGEQVYLEKAMAAANAICAGQWPNGMFSTVARDYETGVSIPPLKNPRDPNDGDGWTNWYCLNGWAISALYELDAYVKTVSK